MWGMYNPYAVLWYEEANVENVSALQLFIKCVHIEFDSSSYFLLNYSRPSKPIFLLFATLWALIFLYYIRLNIVKLFSVWEVPKRCESLIKRYILPTTFVLVSQHWIITNSLLRLNHRLGLWKSFFNIFFRNIEDVSKTFFTIQIK